ncbi:tRNA (32-2'-O)-methyltransferase regulator THADA-like [Glandiceps talaboti]
MPEFEALLRSNLFIYSIHRKECPKSDEDKMAEFWSQYWRSHLIHALCHNTQLLRHNASHYWLPWTLKVFPSAFHLLTEVLRCNPSEASSARCLHSQISVLNAARNLNLIHGSDLTSEPICEALWHSDDDIRSDTVGLLCTSHRKSESMSELELTLLKNFFPLNMNCDSSSFRQHLYAYTKRLIVRIRDSCIAMVKQYKKTSMTDVDPPRQLQMSVEFVDWLYSLCISSLFPGSSYQRRKTSLELIIAVLEGFITENTTCQRKGQTPGAVEVLISWATEHNKWSFFSNRNASVLLHCLEDGTNEIRELSYSVLTNYFPWPLMCCENSVDSAECQILQHCYHLLCSPKAMQCESGALMCKMVCKQYTTGLGWDFNMVTTTPGNVTITKDTETTNKYCKLHFIKQLVQLLADQYHCAKRNLLKAASTSPMHGIVLALRRCLTEDTDIAAMTTGVEATEWRSLIGQILSMVETIINSMLQVLFGKNANPDTDTSPDFAEMGLAIDEVIAESLGEDSEYEESAVISTEHQLILACCWLNIKECSQLLGSFANKFSFSLESSNGLLTTEQVRTMADIFVKILTKCRHRGAIEGCSLGFIKLCSRLLSSSIQELSSIPKNILVQTFSLLESPKSGTSITRRSAGLPLIIEAITSCEPKGREKLLLKQCMERLLIAVHQPLPESAAQTMDLPQVHAFNILRSLFRSSVLGNAMLKYACDVVMVTIKGFSSPSWAVRNGCTLLYGTLVARMLGQKRVQDEHSQLNSITAQEFFVRYPKLYPFLLSQLEEASQYQKDNKLCLYPALHPVLTLLSKLGPGIQQDNTQCSLTKFIEPVMKLSSSPIYTVRVLAAAALVPLVAMKDKVETLAAILDNIPDSASMVKSHNKLHGMLLQTEKLLFSVLANIRRHEDTVNISKHLLKKIWLASEKNLCCLTKALYLDILIKFCTQVRCNDDAVHLLSTLNEIIKKSVSEVEVTPVRSIQIGDAMLSRAKVTASLKMASDENKQKEFLTEFLVCDNREIRYSSLQYVAESLRSETNTVRFLKEFLLKYITEHLTAEQDMACLHTKLELFIELSEELDLSVCEENLFSLCDVLLPLANGDRGTTLTAVAIPALACIVKQHIHHRKYRNLICELCCLVDKYSKSTNVEDLRLSVTKTLQIVGCQIITMIAQSLDEDLLPFAFRIFTSSVQLLQDEIQEVRMAAAEFTVLLPRPPCFVRYSSLHSNAGLQLLMMYFFMVFDWSDSFLDFILGYLQGNITPVQAIKDQHLTSSVHLFEQEDANIYAEHLITVQMMYTNLHKLVDKGIKERYFRDTVKSTLQSTITILKATHDEIQTSPKQGYGIHGVLGYTKPFLAVHRLILYSNLLLSVARQKVARQKGDLDEEITTLSQELQLCISMLCQIGSTAHNMKCTGESFAKFPTINE